MRFLVTFLIAGAALAQAPSHVPGRLIAAIRPEVESSAVESVLRMHGATSKRHIGPLSLITIDVSESNSAAIIASLQSSGMFRFVERDRYAALASTPNDPKFPMQWHLPAIHAPEAWALTTGAATVMIAIIDSGVDNSHPDVGPKILPGWNFVSGSVEIDDYIGHGTAVAGAIGAASDNGVGITGVTWKNPLLPIVVVDNNNYASYSDIASAIQYAVDRGARIINISLGGTAPSAALQSAVDYAWAKGSLVFAAAMNDGQSIAYYPAACNHAVAVSATDSEDRLADFSNYGDWIALSAPGANILSTAMGGGYGFWNGTSFAAPIAAGVAALALAANPELDAAELLSVLENSADDLGPPGHDPQFGWGRVNAHRAVETAVHFGERRQPQHVPVAPPPATRH